MIAFPHLVLPEHISEAAVTSLVMTIAEALGPGFVDEITTALSDCDLQPTSRATYLAASAAVAVLLAHEIGQEVNP